MKIARPMPRRVRIEMLPLIDIVFLLLVVFIYAMLSMAVHRGLPVELPASETTELERDSVLAITVDAQGLIHVDRQPVVLAELTATLRAREEDGTIEGVQLFADRTVDYQTLFRVLDAVRLAGIESISLEAEEE